MDGCDCIDGVGDDRCVFDFAALLEWYISGVGGVVCGVACFWGGGLDFKGFQLGVFGQDAELIDQSYPYQRKYQIYNPDRNGTEQGFPGGQSGPLQNFRSIVEHKIDA